MLEGIRRFYAAFLLQEDLEEEHRVLSLRGRFHQARVLAVPVLLTSLALNTVSLVAVREIGGPAARALPGSAWLLGICGAEVLSLALFLLVGSAHLRAGLWFGIFHVATAFAALATTLTYSSFPVLYLWMGFLLGLSTSFCFGWSRAWYQVALSYTVILLFGTLHVTRLFVDANQRGQADFQLAREGLWFLLPNVGGFFVGLYSFHGFVAWTLFSSVVYLLASLLPWRAPALLQLGPVHLDNTLPFALPFLSRHLLLAWRHDPAAAWREIEFLFERRPAQRKVARAALDRLLLASLKRTAGPRELKELLASELPVRLWRERASEDLRDFLAAILGDGRRANPWRSVLQRLEELTGDWGQGKGQRQELRIVVNRWRQKADLGEREIEIARPPVAEAGPAVPGLPAAPPPAEAFPRERLRQALTEQFSNAELKLVLYDLQVDWEDLPGAIKSERVVELLSQMERRNEIERLLATIERHRPGFRSGLSQPRETLNPGASHGS